MDFDRLSGDLKDLRRRNRGLALAVGALATGDNLAIKAGEKIRDVPLAQNLLAARMTIRKFHITPPSVEGMRVVCLSGR